MESVLKWIIRNSILKYLFMIYSIFGKKKVLGREDRRSFFTAEERVVDNCANLLHAKLIQTLV
jgi:hypothetical protein